MPCTEIYVIVEVREIRDAEAFAAYRAAARQQLDEWGGILVARGEGLFEGEPPMGQMLIQRWPSVDAFRAWQNSDAYRPLRDLRRKCAKLRIAVLSSV